MNDAYFEGNPIRLDVSRSKKHHQPRWTGSWNAGVLVPIFCTSLIQPGDGIYNFDLNSAIRMVTPSFPTMDDLEITVEAYFVPNRLILSRKSMSPDVNDSNHSWAAFIGAQDSTLNMPLPGSVTLPKFKITANQTKYDIGSLGDCLGYPLIDSSDNNTTADVNCLKVLAYYSIWNEYFREPSTRNPVTYSIDGNGYVSVVGTDAGIPAGGSMFPTELPCAPVSVYHGYFGSALPWPQRNSTTVTMPLGEDATLKIGASYNVRGTGSSSGAWFGTTSTSESSPEILIAGTDGRFEKAYKGVTFDPGLGSEVSYTGIQGDGTARYIRYTNLYADLSTATAASVNAFRLAVQTQRWYEHLARAGNKYSDMIAGMWGVNTTTIQDRPEYLGGFTAPISVTQVAVTSSSDTGELGAFSLSNPSGRFVNKSFTEHGVFMVVACVRCKDSFCQGVQQEDLKFDRLSFYWPEFANLGEMPLYKKFLYINGSSTDEDVFGYQEAWSEYRMFQDRVVGYCKPTVNNGLGAITYCNEFTSHPTLKSFLDARRLQDNVNRTLVNTNPDFEFFGQFQFDFDMVRPMPMNSLPGLVDHH